MICKYCDGRADKSSMVAFAERRIGRKVTDDNEADAVAVGLWAWDNDESSA
jgi:hypothetical protein